MKKIIGIVLLAAIIAGTWLYLRNHNQGSGAVDYSQVVNHSESQLLAASAGTIEKLSLTTMLEAGIKTTAGVIKSTRLEEVKGVGQYSLMLDDKPTGLTTVSQIELIKGFSIDNKQVMLLGFDQGGNQCSRQYVTLTISDKLDISKPFGSCLPLTAIIEENNAVVMVMPQNNPYLGDDFTVSYRYENGVISQLTKVKTTDAKQKFGKMSATDILNVAAKDGCYQDGVMLDDNSCGNGRKYCAMFKSIVKEPKNQDYKFLKDFCTGL